MEAANVAATVSEISDTSPVRESHAAELAPLRDEPDQLAEAWEEAQERAEAEERPVTAQDVREAVEPVGPEPAESSSRPRDDRRVGHVVGVVGHG